ncbi:MAG: hypothetical protein ABJK39_03350 [Hyphomicrobiales bacterium]
MKTLTQIAMALALTVTTATSALAESPLPNASDDIVQYGQVEGWTVYKNNTSRHCFLSSIDESGAIQMGVTKDDISIGYLGVFTTKHLHIKDGKKSKIAVSIDGNIYTGTATGISKHITGGYSGGYILTRNEQFKKDLATKYEMVVFPQTKHAFVVDLKGTYKAMKLARECFIS